MNSNRENNVFLPQQLANLSDRIKQNLGSPANLTTRPQEIQPINQDHQEFKEGINNLLQKLRSGSQPATPILPQMSVSPSTVNVQPGSPQLVFPQQAQNSNMVQSQARALKEDNIHLQQQLAQVPQIQRQNLELKQAIQVLNNQLQQQQGRLDEAGAQINALKQQVIKTEQEKIGQKSHYEGMIAKQQLQYQRDLQTLQVSSQDAINSLDMKMRQQEAFLRSQFDTYANTVQAKQIALERDNQILQQKSQDLTQQCKAIQLTLDQTAQEKYILQQSEADKRREIDKLNTDLDTALSKYESNIKGMQQEWLIKRGQYEEAIKQLQNECNVRAQQLVEQEKLYKKQLLDQKNNYQNQLQDYLNQQQNNHYNDAQQNQGYYNDKLVQIQTEKDQLRQQHQKDILALNQQLQQFIQEAQNQKDTAESLKKKLTQAEKSLAQTTASLQQVQTESSFKIKQLIKANQDLSDQVNNPKRATNQELIKLQQQLDYKREEMELLITHIDSIIALNKQQEAQMQDLQKQLAAKDNNNSKENEAYFQQIKQQKQSIQEMTTKIEQMNKKDKLNDQTISELKNKLAQISLQDSPSESATIKQLNEKLQQQYQASTSLQKQLADLKLDNQRKEEQINQLSYELQDHLLNSESAQQQINELNDQLKSTRKEKAHLSMHLLNSGMASLVQQQQ